MVSIRRHNPQALETFAGMSWVCEGNQSKAGFILSLDGCNGMTVISPMTQPHRKPRVGVPRIFPGQANMD